MTVKEPAAPRVPATSSQPQIQRLRRLSHLMDSAIRLPGGYRIGWDGLIGLVPGIGDLAGAGVSAWIVMGAARAGASKAIVARMLLNMGIETLIGAIPVAGDLFDFVFKANNRNMRLLEEHLADPQTSRRHSKLWLLALAGVLLGVVVLIGWAVLAVLEGLLRVIF